MRRPLIIWSSVLLLAGATVNVAVVVACTIVAQQWSGSTVLVSYAEAASLSGELLSRPDPDDAWNWGSRMESFGYYELTFFTQGVFLRRNGSVSGSLESVVVKEIEAGWPFRAFHRRQRNELDQSVWIAELRSFVIQPRVASADSEYFIIPWTPIWNGLAVNSLIYAIALWTALMFPSIVRRRFRTRRGLCPHCAYPVGISDRCSECGTPIPTAGRRYAETTC